MFKQLKRNKFMLVVLSLFLCLAAVTNVSPVSAAAADRNKKEIPQLQLVVRTSPDTEHRTVLSVKSSRWVETIAVSKREAVPILPKNLDVTVILRDKQKTWILAADQDGNIYDPAAGQKLLMPAKFRRSFSKYVKGLRAMHYGKPLPWNEVSREIPRMTRVTILDLQTGLRFRAQRRAGSSHADMQPLTKADTEVMKQLYKDGWSWNRRAVLVQGPDTWIAASMNGMPHGGDGIPGNGFDGHFCIHFNGSMTHGSDLVDPMHQAMVFRAAGQLDSFLSTLEPVQLAELYAAGAHQRDNDLLMRLLPVDNGKAMHPLADELPQLTAVKLLKHPEKIDVSQSLEADVPLDIAITREGSGRQQKERLHILCHRESLDAPWKIKEIVVE